ADAQGLAVVCRGPCPLPESFDRSHIDARSKTRQVRERDLAVVHMQLAEFGAAVRGWNRLVRIEQRERIERMLDREKGVELLAAELHAHRVDLFLAHAMFAGDGAAHLDAQR